MSVRTTRRRPGPCSPPSQLMSRPSASKQLPLVRPLSARNVVTAPFASILRMRLPAMSLKNTLPVASTAGPSRKQITAAGAAAVFSATSPAGSGVFDRSSAAHRHSPGANSATIVSKARNTRPGSFIMAALLRPQGRGGDLDGSFDVLVRVRQRQVQLASRRAIDAAANQLVGEGDGLLPVRAEQIAVIAKRPVVGEEDLQDRAVAQDLQRDTGVDGGLPQTFRE